MKNENSIDISHSKLNLVEESISKLKDRFKNYRECGPEEQINRKYKGEIMNNSVRKSNMLNWNFRRR